MRRTLPVGRDPSYEWIDLISPERDELEAVARDLEFPEESVQDSLEPEHLPKLERFGDRTFLLVRSYDETCGEDAATVQAVSNKVALFLAPGRMVTIHRREESYLAGVAEAWAVAGESPRPSQPELLAAVVEAAVNTFTNPLEHAEDGLDAIEERLFSRAGPTADLEQLHFLKRRISAFKRLLWHSLAVIQRLPEQSGGRHAALYQDLRESAESLYYYADELLESANNLLGLQLSLASHRTSEVIRVLTVFSVFFLPLTFIVGVYGMNFVHMPEIPWRWGYLAVWGLMLLVTGSILYWFRKRGWLRW
jgi:magnesium transporter